MALEDEADDDDEEYEEDGDDDGAFDGHGVHLNGVGNEETPRPGWCLGMGVVLGFGVYAGQGVCASS
jgi:hypothetical protein